MKLIIEIDLENSAFRHFDDTLKGFRDTEEIIRLLKQLSNGLKDYPIDLSYSKNMRDINGNQVLTATVTK